MGAGKLNVVLLEDSNIEFVFVSGSLVEGFGNRKSDVDVYVICNSFGDKLEKYEAVCSNEIFIKKGNYYIHWLEKDGTKYDIEYHLLSSLLASVEHLETLQFGKYEKTIINPLNETSLELMHRFKVSRPLRYEKKYDEVYKRVKFRNLQIEMAILKLHKYESIMEDVLGAEEDNDYGTVYIALRKAVDACVNAYLACFGETNPNDKWIYKKIIVYVEQTKDRTLLEDYIKAISLPYNEDLLHIQVTQICEMCGRLNEYVSEWIRD